MLMGRRYLFVCADRTSASGGAAVIYDMVHTLNQLGYEAAILHNGPYGSYADYPNPVPAFYTRKAWEIIWRQSRPMAKIRMAKERFFAKGVKIPPLDLRPTDIIVSPEFMLAEAIEAFQGFPILVFIQNPFGLMMSYHRAVQRGFSPQIAVKYWLGIADVCRSHMSILGLEPGAIFPVSMKPHEFPYREEKQKLITYMPRKRPWEAALIAEALNKRGNLRDYKVEALQNIPRLKVAERLAESRIFISLLHQEALGFPAAEAMATGSIVVGFDGLGTAEYFDESTGIPITEGDVASLVYAVEETIAEYEADPTRLDAMRKRASQLVNERYSVEAFESGVKEVWAKVDAVF
jgi:hypothetical protein